MNKEHWRTQMSCVCCSETPDESPIYQCDMGHTICLVCFKELLKYGNPKCTKCMSEKFEAVPVSSSFLKKLKNKPHVGSMFRSCNSRKKQSKSNIKNLDLSCPINNGITIEQLFQLSKEQLQYLFDQTFEERHKSKLFNYDDSMPDKLLKTEKRDQEINKFDSQEDTKIWLRKSSTMSLKKNVSVSSLFSRKPLNCPHDPCKKIIAISSFYTHFKYDHPEITRYTIERGKELTLPFDISTVEHNRTICFGLITVYDLCKRSKSKTSATNVDGNKKVPVDTFWIMLSGSPEEIKSHSYVLVWLFTNNDEYYNCTIEVSSEKDNECYSTFCGVNDMHDSQNIVEIAQRLNCLYLSYGSVKNILRYGKDINLTISIH